VRLDRPAVNATCLWLVLLLGAAAGAAGEESQASRVFAAGVTWDTFAAGLHAQRDLWVKTIASARVSPAALERFRRVSRGVRFLVVAEDWCPDSANVVPYVAELAKSGAVPLRVVDRTVGRPLMNAHPAPDGRPVTPTIVVLRESVEAGAWVERPAALQRWFLSMGTDAESARQFANRQSWYDMDQGRTIVEELIALVERTSPSR
jgi:thioredoxin family protein